MASSIDRETKKKRDEIEKQIHVIQRTGKLKYGFNNALKAIQRGYAKVVIVASNIPEDLKLQIKYPHCQQKKKYGQHA